MKSVGRIEQLTNKYTDEFIDSVFPLIKTQSSDLTVGDWWYVKLGPNESVVERKISDLTRCTVELFEETIAGEFSFRYEISEIKFIEKVEKDG